MREKEEEKEGERREIAKERRIYDISHGVLNYIVGTILSRPIKVH